jgi:ABC-type antimicrobial peptide transport system permease subunit
VIKSYFKVALRNLYKNKLYTGVNIVGLGVAMAMCVAGYVNYQFGKSFNAFHENADKIYLINSYRIETDTREDWTYAPLPLGKLVREEVPGIKKLSRYSVGGATVRYGDAVFNESIYFADRDFFEMFTFPILVGTDKALSNKNSIVIADEMALKYFGEEDPVGKMLTVSPDGEQFMDFTVEGIFVKPPKNSSLPIGFVVPFENIEELRGFDLTSWENWARTIFIQVADNASPGAIEEKLQAYTGITNEANQDWQIKGFFLTPLKELASAASDLNGHYFPAMHPTAVMAPSITAFLVLLLACFNFINTAVAFASRRLNEIGIRKVVGGVRSQLIKQFIGENLILCFVALVVAAVLAEVFVPAYDSLWPDLSLSLNYSENLGLIGFLVGLLLFTGIAAGAYPAFYITRFHPVEILKRKQKLGGTNPLIRILLTFQLSLSMISIIAAIIMTQNAEYIRTMNLGFDREHILMVPINGESQYDLLKTAVVDHPEVLSISGTRHLMGRFWSDTEVEIDQKDIRLSLFQIGENHFETFGFKLVEGRPFDADLITDIDDAVIVNETLVRQFTWESAIGMPITFKYTDSSHVCQIVGVVRDFHPNGVESRVRPTAMRFVAPDRYRFVAIKCTEDSPDVVSAYVEQTWKQLFPHLPYDGFWHEETLFDSRQINESIRLVFLYIAWMVVIISGMGLFALVSLNIAKRTKEIGIRKVLGATISNISLLIGREFIWMIVIGGILASVLGYFMMDMFLSSIWTYYCDFSATPFILAAVLLFGVALLTVGLQVFRVASSNPVNAIRDE